MQHPLITDLDSKIKDELTKTVSDLQNKLRIAQRSGNGHLCQQIRMALESYQTAYRSKLDEEMKANEDAPEFNFDKIKIS